MNQKTPAAFMSYVHSDDKYKQLTTFRERLSDEVGMQTGSDFPIFQDRKDIQWGQHWRERIENSLDEVTFLIPIITPSFFNSEHCREELKRFIEREEKLKRNDLIFPVYFVDTPLLNDAALRVADELAEVIASRQYADWRDLRFEPFTNPQVGKTLAQLAMQIRNALPTMRTIKKAPPRTSAVPSAAATKGEGNEQPTKGPTAKIEPPTCIVDPMHRGDFATITDAIKSVEPGSRILVRPGLYQEGLIVDKPLEIIGEGEPGDIVIHSVGMDVVLFQTTMGRLVNLTLRQMGGPEIWYCVDIAQGRLELEDCDIISHSSACVAIHGGADPRLRRNRIHGNETCGVYVYEGGLGTLEDNNIYGNTFSGVEIETTGNPTLRRNRIYDGKAGGVFVNDGGQGTLEDNDIFSNASAGVQVQGGANPTLRRNRIRENRHSGVYVYEGGLGIFEDNDILSNTYSGIYSSEGGNPVVRNNRINKNGNFGVKLSENGGGRFENNDLTGNAKGAWSIAPDSEANVTRANNKE